jgi:hypothetical protein
MKWGKCSEKDNDFMLIEGRVAKKGSYRQSERVSTEKYIIRTEMLGNTRSKYLTLPQLKPNLEVLDVYLINTPAFRIKHYCKTLNIESLD